MSRESAEKQTIARNQRRHHLQTKERSIGDRVEVLSLSRSCIIRSPSKHV